MIPIILNYLLVKRMSQVSILSMAAVQENQRLWNTAFTLGTRTAVPI